ncbi:MAG: alpha/beta hydrolase [Actinobacteria bacterium]|nr:alpha/beta hydrolase [Actinomycetota bacterium]
MDRSSSFTRVANCLKDLHVVSYDRRGYGHSLNLDQEPEGLEGHVEDMFSVMRTFGSTANQPVTDKPKSWVVVGHSYGGLIALTASVHDLDKLIKGIVAYEPPLPWITQRLDERLHDPNMPSAGDKAVQTDDPSEAAEVFLRHMLSDAVWGRLPERTKAARRLEGKTLLKELSDIHNIRITKPPFVLEQIKVPITLVRGTTSIKRLQAAAGYLAESAKSPGAVKLVEIRGAGHGAHITHPKQFAVIIKAAVDEAADKLVNEDDMTG